MVTFPNPAGNLDPTGQWISKSLGMVLTIMDRFGDFYFPIFFLFIIQGFIFFPFCNNSALASRCGKDSASADRNCNSQTPPSAQPETNFVRRRWKKKKKETRIRAVLWGETGGQNVNFPGKLPLAW